MNDCKSRNTDYVSLRIVCKSRNTYDSIMVPRFNHGSLFSNRLLISVEFLQTYLCALLTSFSTPWEFSSIVIIAKRTVYKSIPTTTMMNKQTQNKPSLPDRFHPDGKLPPPSLLEWYDKEMIRLVEKELDESIGLRVKVSEQNDLALHSMVV